MKVSKKRFKDKKSENKKNENKKNDNKKSETVELKKVPLDKAKLYLILKKYRNIISILSNIIFFSVIVISFLVQKRFFDNKLHEKVKEINGIKEQLNVEIKEKDDLKYKFNIQNTTFQNEIVKLQNKHIEYQKSITSNKNLNKKLKSKSNLFKKKLKTCKNQINSFVNELNEKETTINTLIERVIENEDKLEDQLKERNLESKINLKKRNVNDTNTIFKDSFDNSLKSILNDDELLENEPMKKHTTFRIGGPARYFVKPKTINQITNIIKLCNEHKVDYFILGNGSNLLVSDEGYHGVVIHIHEHNFSSLKVIKKDKKTYILRVGGGMLMKRLSIEAGLLSLKGLDEIIDIPGTVAGGIIMNVSFYGIGLEKPLSTVKVITPEGHVKELTKEECGFYRRGSLLRDKKYLILEATFELEKGDQMAIQKSMTNNTEKRYKKTTHVLWKCWMLFYMES